MTEALRLSGTVFALFVGRCEQIHQHRLLDHSQLRAQNYAACVPGKKSERTVFTMAKFTIPDDKCLVVELNEKNGGRHQSFVIENEDLVRANTINELQVR